jgi:hypothetical protein
MSLFVSVPFTRTRPHKLTHAQKAQGRFRPLCASPLSHSLFPLLPRSPAFAVACVGLFLAHRRFFARQGLLSCLCAVLHACAYIRLHHFIAARVVCMPVIVPSCVCGVRFVEVCFCVLPFGFVHFPRLSTQNLGWWCGGSCWRKCVPVNCWVRSNCLRSLYVLSTSSSVCVCMCVCVLL